MAGKPTGLEGLHFVRRRLSGGKTRWHVYAWRGGPKIMEANGAAKPRLTAEAVAAYTEAHLDRSKPRKDTFASLATAYLGSAEYLRLADSTRRQWRIWIDRAREKFGKARLKAVSDPRMRGDILDWRDQWAASPRTADYAMQCLSRVLSWGLQRGWVMHNPASGVESLYKVDRSSIVWTDEEIEALAAKLKPHVARAFRLAAWTGLARGDLVALRWEDVKDDHIERPRGKTGVEQIIPLFDETRAFLAECPRTRSGTVVTNARGDAFTAVGFADTIRRAQRDAKLAKGKTLHDLRGTFATRLMAKGFEDREIDEILGWETGKSARIRRRYINRKAVVEAAIERMRKD